jgi:hypothetical protein
MDMDFDKLLKFSTDYLSEYFFYLISTLQNPRPIFKPYLTQEDDQSKKALIVNPLQPDDKFRLNPKIFSFIIISIFLGLTISMLVPNRKKSPGVLEASVVIILFWLFYSVLIYLISKILNGKGEFIESISVSLQLFASIYVVCNFITLLWGISLSNLGYSYFSKLLNYSPFNILPSEVYRSPYHFYFVMQYIILSIYIPIAFKRIHRFKWFNLILFYATLLVIVLPLIIIFNLLLYRETGVFHAPPF